MVINETRQLPMGHAAPSQADGLIARIIAWFTQLFCGLIHGHHSVLHFEGERMLLRCTSCGFDSPGWDTRGERPRLRFAGDPRRHAHRARRNQPAVVPVRKAS